MEKKVWLLAFILILATFLRVWRMWEWPVTGDEVTHFLFASDMLKGYIPIYAPVLPFQGPMVIYLLIPSVFFFGNNLFFLRLPIVLVSIFSIILLYLFTKKYYNENVALFAAFILAITPNDFLLSSTAIEISLIPFFMVFFLYLFCKYAETEKNRYFYILSFISGLAVISRPTFFFFLAAFLLTLKINPIMPFKKIVKSLSLKKLSLFFLFFLLGSFPMIYYNIHDNLPTLDFFVKNFLFASKSAYNEELFDLRTNLYNGYFQYEIYLNKAIRYHAIEPVTLYSYFFYIFLVASILFLIIPIKKFYETKNLGFLKKNLYLVLVFFIILSLKSTVTVTEFAVHDYMILNPLSSIIIGWSIVSVAELLKKRKIIFYSLVILFFTFYTSILFNAIQSMLVTTTQYYCYKLLDDLSSYSKSMNISSMVFDTSLNYLYFKFYNPNVKSTYLTDLFYNMIDDEKAMNETINNKNNFYVFIHNSCNPRWIWNLGIINVYEKFVDFLKYYNKTAAVEKSVFYNNILIFKIVKVV